ncbi:MAG: hypothetical protein GY820_08510 [Gammaproteobacteria bacterium]|nr:hypothetical protein [Gammaproteobacteria bacterium]
MAASSQINQRATSVFPYFRHFGWKDKFNRFLCQFNRVKISTGFSWTEQVPLWVFYD